MSSLRNTAVSIVSTVALGAFALSFVPSAQADETATEPCATQQAQVDKATAKLDALTAKFAAHPTKKVKKAKKAQVQRVAKATARLEACVAGLIPETSETPETETPEAD
jgi:hypothetical protein